MNLEDIMELIGSGAEPRMVVAALKRGATDLSVGYGTGVVSTALRSIAQAIEATMGPEEPTGLGAVALDDEGRIAVRNSNGDNTGGRWAWWITDAGWSTWGKDFTVSTEEQILSRGVEVDS